MATTEYLEKYKQDSNNRAKANNAMIMAEAAESKRRSTEFQAWLKANREHAKKYNQ